MPTKSLSTTQTSSPAVLPSLRLDVGTGTRDATPFHFGCNVLQMNWNCWQSLKLQINWKKQTAKTQNKQKRIVLIRRWQQFTSAAAFRSIANSAISTPSGYVKSSTRS